MVRLAMKGNKALARGTLATKENRRKIDMVKY